MKDYDLDKIAIKVKEIYKKTGIWPGYVELPRSSYYTLFGYCGTQGAQSIMVSHDNYYTSCIYKLYYRPGDGNKPIIRWSKGLHNHDVVKDKKYPPNLRTVPVESTCGNCTSSTPHSHMYVRDQVRCHRYGMNLNNNNYCDDWRGDV